MRRWWTGSVANLIPGPLIWTRSTARSKTSHLLEGEDSDNFADHRVQKEVETAFEKEEKGNSLVLFPIRLDDVVMQIDVGWAADIRRQRHIGDFTRWKEHDMYQKAFG